MDAHPGPGIQGSGRLGPASAVSPGGSWKPGRVKGDGKERPGRSSLAKAGGGGREGRGQQGHQGSRSLVVPVLMAGVPETQQCRWRSQDPEQQKQGGIEPSEVKWA